MCFPTSTRQRSKIDLTLQQGIPRLLGYMLVYYATYPRDLILPICTSIADRLLNLNEFGPPSDRRCDFPTIQPVPFAIKPTAVSIWAFRVLLPYLEKRNRGGSLKRVAPIHTLVSFFPFFSRYTRKHVFGS